MDAHHKYGERSLAQLETCHPDLQKIFHRVLELSPRDITILEGHRSDEDQIKAKQRGHSQVGPEGSAHCCTPSLAVDAAPLVGGNVIPWNDHDIWIGFSQFVVGVAAEMGFDLVSGTDWDRDWDFKEHTLFDGPHFELADWRSIRTDIDNAEVAGQPIQF